MKKPSSIKVRLTAVITLAFLIVTVFFTLCLLSISNSVYKKTVERSLIELVRTDIEKIKGMENGKLSVDDGFIYELSGDYVSIFTENGGLLAGSIPLGFNNQIDFKDKELRVERGENSDFLILDVFYPIGWEGGLWIRGFSEMNDRTKISGNLLMAAGFTLPFFLVIIGILSYFLTRMSLRPLDIINAKASEINDGEDLSKRIDIGKADTEFMNLSDSMNGMLERLEDSFEREKRFTSDVSHELRTPISVIKSAAEYSLKYDGDSDWRESMEMIKRNADTMGDMTESLLMLSRMDLGTIKSDFSPFDFSGFLTELLDSLSYSTIRNIEPDIEITGDRQLLSRAVLNLVENAKKYGKENGSITVSLNKDTDGTVTFSVKDDGIGIEKEKLPYIFDRFYRADESRNSHIPGTGLGLSLVYEIVKLHGAEISCDSIPSLGTEFKIIF